MSTSYTVRINDQVYEALVDDPQAPICSVCGHELCPCCTEAGLVSCDTVVRDEDGEPDFCSCDECVVDTAALEEFRSEVRRRRMLACFGGNGALFTMDPPASEPEGKLQ